MTSTEIKIGTTFTTESGREAKVVQINGTMAMVKIRVPRKGRDILVPNLYRLSKIYELLGTPEAK